MSLGGIKQRVFIEEQEHKQYNSFMGIQNIPLAFLATRKANVETAERIHILDAA